MHRVHLECYRPAEFNPGEAGNARFSPILAADRARIPTIYGGTSFDCAAMETVFHDVPFVPGLKTFDRQKLIGQRYSILAPGRDLLLADLSATALRKLGIQRNQLIDTEKDQYPRTRPWAEAIHAQCPTLDGLYWVSRQDDRAQAVMLFGDRVAEADLLVTAAQRDLLVDRDLYADLLALADRIGLLIVPGKAR